MAENRHSKLLRLASNRALCLDNLTREGHALAALHPAAERLVSFAGTARTPTRSIAHVLFPDGIADTDNHERS
jgi:hypothetical protein